VVAGNDHYALAGGGGALHVLPTLHAVHQIQHRTLTQSGEQRRLDRRPAEMLPRGAGDALHLLRRFLGKGRGDLFLNYALSDAERSVARDSNPAADATCRLPAEKAEGADHSAERVKLGPLRQRGLHPASLPSPTTA
jgi:hypothetical protein